MAASERRSTSVTRLIRPLKYTWGRRPNPSIRIRPASFAATRAASQCSRSAEIICRLSPADCTTGGRLPQGSPRVRRSRCRVRGAFIGFLGFFGLGGYGPATGPRAERRDLLLPGDREGPGRLDFVEDQGGIEVGTMREGRIESGNDRLLDLGAAEPLRGVSERVEVKSGRIALPLF